MRLFPIAVFLLLAAPVAGEGAHDVAPAAPLGYELPVAGSYDLPVIQRLGEHELVSADGEGAPVLALEPGECALVAFVYLSCTDATGCPLSLATLQRVDREVARRDDLRERVRLVTVSFDPARDGPKQMANLRHHMKPRGDWRFLTAESDSQLSPVLVDYGQDAVPLLTHEGRDTGTMRHVAKVFLVDHERGVRNVYSSGFMDHRVLLRDVETLLGP